MKVNGSFEAQSFWRHAYPGDMLRLKAQCRIHRGGGRYVVPGMVVFDRCGIQSKSKSAAVRGEKPFPGRFVRIRLLTKEQVVPYVSDVS